MAMIIMGVVAIFLLPIIARFIVKIAALAIMIFVLGLLAEMIFPFVVEILYLIWQFI